MARLTFALILSVASTVPAFAQGVNLTEKVTPSERSQYSLELDLRGNLVVAVEKGKQTIPLEAKAKHRLVERVLVLTDGLPSTSVRYYSEAAASARQGTDKSERTLAANRKLIVARRGSDGLQCFSPAGPLSREELDLITDHFNTHCVPGLLPGKTVSVGETWSLNESTVLGVCSFDATLKSALTGKLIEVKDGLAAFTITGTAEGVENGSKVSLEVNATGRFDVTAGHIIELTWKQKDDREQGPVNPTSHVEATITLKREPAVDVKDLSDESLGAIALDKVAAKSTELEYKEPRGRYRLLHPREWHVTGQTDIHLVLRLLDRGEFIAQATVSIWNKAEKGKHLAPEEFKKAVASAPGWTPGKILFDQEIPAGAGKWIYKLTVEGKMEGVAVVQSFYLLAGPEGEQIAVTVAAKPDKLKAIGSRDLDLVNSIEFGTKERP